MKKRNDDTEKFIAKNGVKIEYEHDAESSKPLTSKQWKSAKRVNVKDVLTSDQMQAISEFAVKRVRGRPRQEKVKINTTIRMDPDVLRAFKNMGRGWQIRLNEVLRIYAEKHLIPRH